MPVSNASQSAYAPRFVLTPEPVLDKIKRVSSRLGFSACLVAVIALGSSFVLPYLVVPDGVSFRIWVQFAGIVTAASALGAAGGVVSARTCVRPGYLDLWYARSVRAGLRGACVVATLCGALACALLVRVVSAAPGEYGTAVEFGGLGWLYVAVLFLSVCLPYACYFGLRPLVWRMHYAAAYRGYRIAQWEKPR